MRRVLIAGCGFVGRALASRLIAAGDVVYALARNPNNLPAGAYPIRADLSEPLIGSLPDKLDAVVFAAAPRRHETSDYERTYVLGAQRVATYAERCGARSLIFVSSTAVYRQCEGEWVDEASEAASEAPNGKAMLAAERFILDAPLAGTVLRCSGIYGPGRTRLIDQVRRGETTSNERDSYTNRIHRDDVAGTIQLLLTLPKAPSILIGSDHEPVLRSEVHHWLAVRMGLAAATALPHANESATSHNCGGKRCSNQALLGLGYRFQYPTFRDGYSAMLETEASGETIP